MPQARRPRGIGPVAIGRRFLASGFLQVKLLCGRDDAMLLRRVHQLVEYFTVRVVISLIQALRIETCAAAARWLAWFACDVLRIRGAVVDRNLQIAFPDWPEATRRQVARQMWEHLLLMVCEIAHIQRKIHETNWRKFVDVENKRQWIRAVSGPGPKVCVTGHFGNFEVLGHVSNFWGFRTYTVARTLDNPYLDRLVQRFRESMGQRILPKADSATQADEVLATGGILALLGDQHAGRKGCRVEFLGQGASCHKALALFSLLHRAPLLVATCSRAGRPLRFAMRMDGLLDAQALRTQYTTVEEVTQWYNDVLAARIRAEPEQYWWLHDRWKDRRRQEAIAAASSASRAA